MSGGQQSPVQMVFDQRTAAPLACKNVKERYLRNPNLVGLKNLLNRVSEAVKDPWGNRAVPAAFILSGSGRERGNEQ